MKKISLSSRLRRQDHILKQEAEGTMVLLRMDGGQYYALNEVGSQAWELLDGNHTVSEVATTLWERFDAPLPHIRNDLIELLTDLIHEKLVVENP